MKVDREADNGFHGSCNVEQLSFPRSSTLSLLSHSLRHRLCQSFVDISGDGCCLDCWEHGLAGITWCLLMEICGTLGKNVAAGTLYLAL